MLVDEYNGNILPLLCEAVKRALNGRVVRLAVYDEEVLLRVRGRGDVLFGSPLSVSCWCEGRGWGGAHADAGEEEASY